MYAYNYLQSHRYLKILYQWLCCLFTVQCRQLNEPIQESCRIIYGHSIYDFFHTFIIIDVSRFNLKIGIYVGKESFFFLNWRISSYKSYLLTYICQNLPKQEAAIFPYAAFMKLLTQCLVRKKLTHILRSYCNFL